MDSNRSVARSAFLLANLMSLVLLIFVAVTRSQAQENDIHSEAPIFYKDGERMSNMLYVKFKERIVDLPKGVREVSLSDFSPEFPELVQELRKMSGRYAPYEIRKAIPSAVWGDVVRKHRRTGMPVTLIDMSQLLILRFSGFVAIDRVIVELQEMPEVAYAHGPIQAVDTADPNDPKYIAGDQWNLAKIAAPATWDLTKGSSAITVGIIDSKGVWRAHPDFTNVDGSSQFVPGKGDNTFSGIHGTEVAGVVAAATNNNDGIAGLGWNVKMIPYYWAKSTPTDLGNLPAKIDTAVNVDSVDILNLSFVTLDTCSEDPACFVSRDYPTVRDAVKNAIDIGIIVVAAAGNKALNTNNGQCRQQSLGTCDPFPYTAYPANNPGVIGVSATDDQDLAITASTHGGTAYNYGDSVDVAAPGWNVLTTGTTASGLYILDKGSSFAAPHVAALAALILSINTSLSPAQIQEILENTADKVGQFQYVNGRNDYLGYGRINAYAAVLEAAKKSFDADATGNNNGRRIVRDNSGKYHLVFGSGGNIYYRRSLGGGTVWQAAATLSTGSGNQYPSIAADGNNLYVTWQQNTGGSHDVYFHKSTDGGNTWNDGDRQLLAASVGSSEPLPVIASPSGNNVVVAYRKGGNIESKHSSNNGGAWSMKNRARGATLWSKGLPSDTKTAAARPSRLRRRHRTRPG